MTDVTREQLDTPLAELEGELLDLHLLNLLEDGFGAIYVRDLVDVEEADLLAVPNVGLRTVEKIGGVLAEFLRSSE